MLTLCSYLIFVFLYWIASRSTDRYCLRFSRLQLSLPFRNRLNILMLANLAWIEQYGDVARSNCKLKSGVPRILIQNISQSGRDHDTLMHNLHKFYSVRHARMTSRMFKAFQTRRLKPKEIFTNVIYYAFFSSERIHQMWTGSNRAINGYNQTSICTQIQTTIFFLKPRPF